MATSASAAGARRPGRWRAWLLLLVGVALFAGVLALADLEGALSALRAAGWGILAVIASHLLILLANAQALRAALPRAQRCGLGAALRAWWIGDAVNALLPVAQVGGEAARARLLVLAGVPGPAAGAAAVAALTAGLLTLVPFGLAGALGLALLVARPAEALAPALGLGLFALLLLVFVVLQRRGLFGRLGGLGARLSRGRLAALADGGRSLDGALRAFYGDRRRLLACGGWRLLGWLLGAGQVWLTFRVLGVEAGAAAAFVLESLGQIAKAAGFAIPGGLGVQEGGLLGVGALLGLAGELALGVALVKRLRDLLLGLPGLLAFKLLEGRRSLLRAAAKPPD